MSTKFINATSSYYASQVFRPPKQTLTFESEEHDDISINLSVSNNFPAARIRKTRPLNLSTSKPQLSDSLSLIKPNPVHKIKKASRESSDNSHITLQNILLTQIQQAPSQNSSQISTTNPGRNILLGLSHRSNNNLKDRAHHKSGQLFLDQSMSSPQIMKKSNSQERLKTVNSSGILFPKLGVNTSLNNKAWPTQPDLYPYGHLRSPLKNESPFLVGHNVSHSHVPGNHVLAEGQSLYGTHIFTRKMNEVKAKEQRKNECSPTAKKMAIKFGRGDFSALDTTQESQYDLEDCLINNYNMKNRSNGRGSPVQKKVKNPLTVLKIRSHKFFPQRLDIQSGKYEDEEVPNYLSKNTVELPRFVGFNVEHMKNYRKNAKKFEVKFLQNKKK